MLYRKLSPAMADDYTRMNQDIEISHNTNRQGYLAQGPNIENVDNRGNSGNSNVSSHASNEPG